MAVTSAIVTLMARLRRDDARALVYDGLDLSHAFEAALYFACVHDAGLLTLFENPHNPWAIVRLESALSGLLAAESFAKAEALSMVRRRNAFLSAGRALGRGVRPARTIPGPILDETARTKPVLFLARSLRFARYFRPLAESLSSDCAFLIPAGDPGLASMVRGWGFACQGYGPGGLPRGPMGRLIDDCGRHLASEAQAFADVLAQMAATLVVVPEGNAPDDEILARVAERRGIASACIQQGWSPILHPAFHNLNYSAMLVWGEGFAELLGSANSRQHFIATGNFHLRQTGVQSTRGVLFLYQGFDNWMGGREGAEAMLTLTEDLARTMPDLPVFVRPHPAVPLPPGVRTRLDRLTNIRVESPADVSLADAFAKSCISVSAYSTTILESIAAGVVPLIFNTTGIPRYWPDVAAAGAGLEIREPGAALQALRALLEDEAALKAFRAPMAVFTARFFQHQGADALAAAMATLRRLAGLA